MKSVKLSLLISLKKSNRNQNMNDLTPWTTASTNKKAKLGTNLDILTISRSYEVDLALNRALIMQLLKSNHTWSRRNSIVMKLKHKFIINEEKKEMDLPPIVSGILFLEAKGLNNV